MWREEKKMNRKTKIRFQMLGLAILKIISLLTLVGVIICTPVGFVKMVIKSAEGESDGMLLLVAIICLVVSLLTGIIFRYSYKRVIVKNVLDVELPGYTWSPNDGFGQGLIDSNIRLVEAGNKYKSEDFIYGEYKGYHYEQADVKIENVVTERVDFGRHRHTKVRVFKHFDGRMIILDSPVYVKKPVYVFSYYFEHRYGGLYDKLTSEELKDKVFGELFDVKVQMGGSARTILDEKMKKILLAAYNKYNKIAVHFQDKKMYIAINTKESAFDWRWTRGFSFKKEVEAARDQIYVIKDIVDALTSEDVSDNNSDDKIKM